ncbi:MAG: family N-acetyltransferase [Actinomycetia bacterium]|nr:family N-acetyltransferase [Actinomycetes bacterium]
MAYSRTAVTTPHRLAERASYDAETVHGILDEALVCHLGFTAGGRPQVLPTLHVRIGETLYLHASTGGGPLLATGAEGLPVCVTVTLVDGIVFARSAFHHSANYRSVVAHGVARLVTDPDRKREVLAALVEHVAAGRSGQCRAPSAKELAATAVLELPLAEVSAKIRTGQAADDDADLALGHWAGVVPLHTAAGPAQPAPGVDLPAPSTVTGYHRGPDRRSPWLRAVPLRGSHVRLDELAEHHARDLYEAGADPEVWRWLSVRQPRSLADMTGFVTAMTGSAARGERVCWAQVDVATGRAIGMTTYYEVDENSRHLGIGGTWIARPWWRTAVNTEAKLLLLTRAFEDLGAIRVTWHTDVRNERSQAAIARLGAVREGVLRNHKIRPDGSLRDSVVYSMTAAEWPAARAHLTARLSVTVR